MTEAEKLKALSDKFHAFEWLRQEAEKGNKYALIMGLEIEHLKEMERVNKEFLKKLSEKLNPIQ